jgi:hypothetical protein
VGLQNIDEYGDAENLKKSIDDVFKNQVCLPQENYTKCLSSATADGASVNTGIYSGLLTRMKNDGRDWLLSIHCISHRVELAIKDAMGKVKKFQDVKELMKTIYYVMKNFRKVSAPFQGNSRST